MKIGRKMTITGRGIVFSATLDKGEEAKIGMWFEHKGKGYEVVGIERNGSRRVGLQVCEIKGGVAWTKDLPSRTKEGLKRRDGRWELPVSDLPRFPEGKDHLPNPLEHDGRQKRWVGIGYVDQGSATGRERLVLVEG